MASFPVIETTNTSVLDTAGTSHTINLPTGISAGDLLLIFFATSNYWGKSSGTLTDPSGFTRLGTGGDGGGFDDSGMTVLYKVATGSEGATIGATTSANVASSHTTWRISNYTGTPFISTFDSGSGDPNPPALTPAGGAKDFLWIAVGAWKDSPGVTAYPTDYNDNQSTLSSSGGQKASHALATLSLNTTTQDPGVFNISDNRKVACTVALAGAPAAAFVHKMTMF